ncbi:myelin-associated glycoprotein-like [Halichoeres trimaculatus]|uniref:myelin-associated glycoprotein-like n=1 Tax=Halichoeres trimaculatus TaxID=147232 RepID=UPI003D9E62DE
MVTALVRLLTACLLKEALGGQFLVSLPQTIDVLRGSCVTIPCSFDVEDNHESNLDETCRARWHKGFAKGPLAFDSSNAQGSTIKGKLNGDLLSKNCTTTLNNMRPEHNDDYFFRVHCDNGLKYTYDNQHVQISVKDDPQRPTLTPSTLEVTEGTSVSLTCSAPAPCLSLPPTLTWTPGLGQSQETLQENRDKTKVQTSVVNFTASHLHNRLEISCTAVYRKQDGSTESSVSSSLTAEITYAPKVTTVSASPSGPVQEDTNVNLTCSSDGNPTVRNYTWYRADGGLEVVIGTGQTLIFKALKDSDPVFCKAENELGAGRSNHTQIDVQYPPQIMPSSDCTKTMDQLNCSCNTSGNPAPTLRWFMDGSPANNSDSFAVRYQSTEGSVVGFISVSQAQWKDEFTLLCHSSNSLGSAAQRFYFFLEPQTSGGNSVVVPILIATVVALLVLVCALLFLIRALKSNHNLLKSQCSVNGSTAGVSQLLQSGEGNEVFHPEPKDEDIYVNTIELREPDVNKPATSSEPKSPDMPHSDSNSAEGEKNISGEANGESKEVIYSNVTWRSKNKEGKEVEGDNTEQEDHTEGRLSRGFMNKAVEMENLYEVEPTNVKGNTECEYAQVKFKEKSDVVD